MICSATLGLAACDIAPVKDETSTTLPASNQQNTQADLVLKANKLVNLAQQSPPGEQQQNYLIRACHLYLDANELSHTKNQLSKLQNIRSANTSSNITNISTAIIESKLALAEYDFSLANQLANNVQPITKNQHKHYYQLKAKLAQHNRDAMSEVNSRIKLSPYLNDGEQLKHNNKSIWHALSNLSSTQLWQYNDNDITNGWLDLAKVVRSGQQNNTQFETALLDWGMRHPTHPANDGFLQELINVYQSNIVKQRHIAVFLPLHGVYAKTTNNIKNGFLSASFADKNSTSKALVKFYDTSDNAQDFFQLYQQAVNAGATNIVGPINKQIISQLTQRDAFEIPVLTLNYTNTQIKLTKNLIQFGLSPEDEAHQVAEFAISQNKRNSAIFYPSSAWGQRLQKAFNERFTELGGHVRTMASYSTKTNDYRASIRQMLNLDKSKLRRRRVETTIARNIKGEPHRRQDIDMIFLVATHRQARGIMPAFKFHHAGKLPVYATSHVYTGHENKRLDSDLNGLIFCDIPWVLQKESPLITTFEKNWPEQKNFTRLFALGVDAYNLVYNLPYLQNKEYTFYNGQTGKIKLDALNRLTRQLSWAKFKQGKAVYFETNNMLFNPN